MTIYILLIVIIYLLLSLLIIMNSTSIIIIASITCIILYFIIVTKKNKENFTALVGLNPLTTYDDYGTFNFLFHTDDFPYYDPTYENLGCNVRTYPNTAQYREKNFKQSGQFDQIIVPENTFINFEGDKVRRELVPENYSQNMDYGSAKFKTNQMYINKKNPRWSMYAPEPFNTYIGK